MYISLKKIHDVHIHELQNILKINFEIYIQHNLLKLITLERKQTYITSNIVYIPRCWIKHVLLAI